LWQDVGGVLNRVGRYRVDELLASGGMGEVHLGRIEGAHGFERPVVIKVIRSELLSDERIALMFIDEARIAAGLHHRNIVQIIDFDRFEGGAYLVTEYVEGCDLLMLLRYLRAAPRYEIAVAILADLATGLDAAHDATDSEGNPLCLVHRDVSPTNVLLGLHGEIKLADFGVAKARSRSYHTVSGSIKGKAPYMAPEQILGEPIDRRADIFSLGILLYEVSTRTPLYSGQPSSIAMKQILSGQLPDPASVRPGYPRALAAIVRRALARRPDDRYQTAGAFVDDLDELSRDMGWSHAGSTLTDVVRLVTSRMKADLATNVRSSGAFNRANQETSR
jgi:eukaryotic-like serine/threonine-protein kinase